MAFVLPGLVLGVRNRAAVNVVSRRPAVRCCATVATVWHTIQRAPNEAGVYRFLSAEGEVLYVGKARRLRNRLVQYVAEDTDVRSGVTAGSGVSERIRHMVEEAVSVDYVVTGSESAALALEAAMIQEVRPRFNVLLKDDRRHPWAVITFSERYPRVMLVRERGGWENDRVYGPFVSEGRLKQMMNCVHEVFRLRQRQKRLFKDRTCINFDLGRCPGVCQELIEVDEYRKEVEKVDMLFRGRVDEVVQGMREEMDALSMNMQYEMAARVRDRIKFVQDVFGNGLPELEAAHIVSQEVISRDVFATAGEDQVKVVLLQVRGGKVINRLVFSATGERSQVLRAVIDAHYAPLEHPMEIPQQVILAHNIELEGLSRVLSEKRGKSVVVKVANTPLVAIAQRNAQLEVDVEEDKKKDIERGMAELEVLLHGYVNSLHRIEGYDISHTSGRNAVASSVVFVQGVPVPAEYRRYYLSEQVSSVGNPDDFESIRQAMRVRFDRLERTLPDLIVIDGGKGQLSAAYGVLKDLGLDVPVISIAKGEEEIFVVGKSVPVNYDADNQNVVMNDGVRLLCRIRDEAHRTAVRAHRKRRGRYTLRSGLNSVKGLGEAKAKKLLEEFRGSVEGVSKARVEDLEKVPGIGPALAQRIYDHFHA